MDKRFRDILPMPHLNSGWFEVTKETDDTLIVESYVQRNVKTEYRLYKDLQNYLKEKVPFENIISYTCKGYDMYTISTRIHVSKREIEANFKYVNKYMEISYKVQGEEPLSEKEKEVLKNVLIYQEKFLKEKSNNRLRYLNIPIFYSRNIEVLLENEKT